MIWTERRQKKARERTLSLHFAAFNKLQQDGGACSFTAGTVEGPNANLEQHRGLGTSLLNNNNNLCMDGFNHLALKQSYAPTWNPCRCGIANAERYPR